MLSANDPIKHFEPIWGNWYAHELLGEGSFGRVYCIRRSDSSGEYWSAVKLISLPRSESEVLEARRMGLDAASLRDYFENIAQRILKEIEIMYALRGEANIVSYEDHMIVHAPDSMNWDILIRMELLVPLDKYLLNNPLQPEDVRRLGLELCAALEACSAYSVVHRDIKEGNVFLNNRGAFKLGDFGIAREMADGSMSMRGTPSYIAPEVYNGQKYGVTADIYSLGILLYKLINNGRHPFLPPSSRMLTLDDTEAAFTRRMRGEEPPPPERGDASLQAAVMRAIRFRPADRFQSAEQFKQALSADGTMLPAPAPLKSMNSGHVLFGGMVGGILLITALVLSLAQSNNPAPKENIKAAMAAQAALAASSRTLAPYAEMSPSPTVPTDAIQFQDPELERIMRIRFNRPDGYITQSDLASITTLHILGSFCPSEYAYDFDGGSNTDGTYKYQGGTYTRSPLENISELAFCVNLRELSVCCTSVSDISALSGLSNVTQLSMTTNYIHDISPLGGMRDLELVRLWRNQISDLSPLERLHYINSLALSSNNIGDLRPLAGLTKLTYLNLYNNRVADLTPLAGLTALEDLRLSNNQIYSVEPLAKLNQLTRLNLHNNSIRDVSSLSKLYALKTLTLQGNMITNYQFVAFVPDLTVE